MRIMQKKVGAGATVPIVFTPVTFSSTETGIAVESTDVISYSVGGGSTYQGGSAQSNNLALGKVYFEARIDSFGKTWMIGLADSANTDPGYEDADQLSVYRNNGNLYNSASPIGTQLGALDVGDILQWVYDTSTGEVWVNRNNNNTWYPGHPNTTSGVGMSIPGNPVTMTLGSGSFSGTNGGSLTVLYGENLTYPSPI